MRQLQGMYKQRLMVHLITTLLITLTIINVIQIYWFSLGIFGIIITAIILLFKYRVSVDLLCDLQMTEGKKLEQRENRKHNLEVFHSYKSALTKATDNPPTLQFTDNREKIFVNNDDRMEYLKNLQQCLDAKYHVGFNNLASLISPHIELLRNIQDLNKSLMTATNLDLLKDLNIKQNLMESTNTLHQLYSYLKEKGNMYSTDHHSTDLGLQGEKRVNQELALYDDILVNIPNVRFEVQGLSVETDNFVISPFGVFAIEVKNLGSSGKFKIKIEKDGRWVKVFRHSSEVMKNVTSQTYRHIGLNQKLMNQELKKLGYKEYIQIQPLIVIANENVEIINESDVPVIRVSNIYHHITQFPKELNQDVISATQKIVEDNMLPPKEYEIEDLSQYIEGTNKYLQSNMDYYHNIYHILTEMENQMKKTA